MISHKLRLAIICNYNANYANYDSTIIYGISLPCQVVPIVYNALCSLSKVNKSFGLSVIGPSTIGGHSGTEEQEGR